jgi:hypothetical protein
MNRLVSLSLLMIVACCTLTVHAQLTYKTSFQKYTTNSPTAIALADFNRDGKPDFAVLQSSILSVAFNLGGGKFGPFHDTTVPSDSFLVEAADVNNDGQVDVVIAEWNTPNLLVLLGKGDGSFRPPINIALAALPQSIALGDFNNDGRVDLAVTECASWNTPCDIAVFLGNGDGTFTLTTVLNTGLGEARSNLIATDFNRDGNLDLATAVTGPSRALVFFGNGNGAFRAPVVLMVNNPLPAQSAEADPDLVAGDFNGDGIPDLAVMAGYVCGGSACGGANITTFLSNGAGGFTLNSRWNDNNAFGPDAIIAADLNNDLRQDLLTFNGSPWVGGVENWLGRGTGSFFLSKTNLNFSTPADVRVRDMNLDGRHDLVASDWMAPGVWVGLSQNGAVNCPPPPSDALRAKICTPGTKASRTFTLRASGNSPLGVKRLELWVDGVKQYETLQDQLRKTLTLTAGRHLLSVVAVDKYVGTSKTSQYVDLH